MNAAMVRALILAVLLAGGFPTVAQVPASDPPPSSTTSEPKPPDPQPSAEPTEQQEEKEKEKKKGALGRLKDHVKDHFSTGCVGAGTLGGCWGGGDKEKGEKEKKDGPQEQGPDKNPAPPRSAENGDPEISSSRETQIDLSPPGQEKKQPQRRKPSDDVQELQHYDPHAAEKDVEVGEYYLKRGNLKAALARFRSALHNKPNDALATFRLAQALEKAAQFDEAREHYERYLQILPKGEFAADCAAALQRLPAPAAESAEAAPTSAPAETLPSKR
jgi:TolA-binding protein